MRAKRQKDVPAAVTPPEVSGDDRGSLTDAYKSGLILSWKRDIERGYCLSLPGRPEEHVPVDQLRRYLAQLRTKSPLPA